MKIKPTKDAGTNIPIYIPQPLIRLGVFDTADSYSRANEILALGLPKGGEATLSVGASGMITARDYDLAAFITSLVMEEYKKCKKLSSRDFLIESHDILEFCRREVTNLEAVELEKSLWRLTENKFEISYPIHGEPYTWEAEGFVKYYDVVERSNCEAPSLIYIRVSSWLHELILKSSGRQARELTPDFFKTTTGLGRFLYLIGCTTNSAEPGVWDMGELRVKSNSKIRSDVFLQRVYDEVKKGIPGFEAAIIERNVGRPALLIRRKFTAALQSYRLYH